MYLKWNIFGGIIPLTGPRSLPEHNAQTAQNVWLQEKELSPIKAPLQEAVLSDAIQKSIYLWRRGGSSEWLSWGSDVNVVQGPIADDQYSRIYYTDGTTLHMKLWNGAKVEVSDVSKTAPSAPTLVSKTLLFDPTRTRLRYGTGASADLRLEYRGHKLEGGLLTYTFFHYSSVPVVATKFYWMELYCESSTPNATYVPVPTTIANEAALYSTISDLTDSGVKFGTFQVLSIDSGPTLADVNNLQSSAYFYGHNVTVTCKLDFLRSSVQYQYYVQTTVDAYGQESPPSAVSAMVEWGINEKITLNATTAGRLYRSATGKVDDNFAFLAENPGATYVDSTIDANLAEKMPLIENPPTAMEGLVSMPGGFLAAFHGKEIYFSEPWLPYSWPTRYKLTLQFDIIGLAVSGNDLLVVTKGNPCYISGSHPEIMTQSKMPYEQACVSKRSIAFAGKFVCYASPDGLIGISQGGMQIITEKFYTRDQWQALTPASMIGCVHDNRYIGFIPTGGIILDFKEPLSALSTTDQIATGLYSDLENDTLYLVQSDKIVSWRAGASYLTYVWKSKSFQNVQDAIFNSVKIISDSYADTTFKMYADGVQVYSVSVTSSNAFRVPVMDRSVKWEIELIGTDTIAEVIVASSMLLLRTGNGIRQ